MRKFFLVFLFFSNIKTYSNYGEDKIHQIRQCPDENYVSVIEFQCYFKVCRFSQCKFCKGIGNSVNRNEEPIFVGLLL